MTRWKNGIDWPTTFWLSTVHLGAFAAPFCFTWSGFLVAVFLAWLTGGVGVALGYHRLLTHNSFQTSLTFRRVLAFLGQMSGEGTALMWVATHRQHHQFSDQPGDPHSPRNGFWWSHCLWFIPTGTDRSRPGYYARYAPDLLRDPFIRFLDRTFVYWHLLLALILFAAGGWSWLVWGVFVRMTFTLNTTWMINSVTHWVGYRNYDTDDDSTNSLWLVPLTFGESLHNNHHAYPSSANNSHRWFELDPSYWTLCLLRRLGLVWSLKGFRA